MTKFLCGECIHNSDKGGGCLIPKNLGYVDNCNRYLPKDRTIVQTNEEWFCQLTTEEKVVALVDLHKKVRMKMRTKTGGENSLLNGDYHREWLKEKHEGG